MKWELLHLTDVHFGDRYTDEDKVPTPSQYRDNLRPKIEDCLSEYAEVGVPHALLVTGDISVRGKAEAMMAGANALRRFCGKMRAAKRSVAIVPGNHDVVWGLSNSDPELFDNKFEMFLTHAVKNLHAHTGPIPVGGLEESRDIQFSTDYNPVVVDEDNKLVIICINSAIRCGELNDKVLASGEALLSGLTPTDGEAIREWMKRHCQFDIAQITGAQRSYLAEKIDEARKKAGSAWGTYLRVAILHHHLIGFSGSATEHKYFEMTIDAPKVLQMLAENEVDLVLTGHKHTPYAERHIVRRESGNDWEIVVAGGATVLGDLPDGVGARGFNRIVVARETNGETTFRFGVIPIGDKVVFREKLKASRDDPHKMDEYRKVSVVSPLTISRTIIPGTNGPRARLPNGQKYQLPATVFAHEPVRLFSGVELGDYCTYCKTLAAASERLFTLLTIDPRRLVDDICGSSKWAQGEVSREEFLRLADREQYHYKVYRYHNAAARVVVWEGDDWARRNRDALPYLRWLNGGMKCFVVKKESLEAMMPRIFLLDHTAVDNQICMYDSSSKLMTVGTIDALNENGYRKYFDIANGQTKDPEFISLDDFIRQHVPSAPQSLT